MEKIIISALQPDQQFAGVLLLTNCEVRKTKTGSTYWDMNFSDGRSVVNGKLWEAPDADAPETKRVYGVYGITTTYASKLQLKLNSFEWLSPEKQDEVASQFMPTREYNIEAAADLVEQYIDWLSGPFKVFCKELILDKLDEWKKATAACFHHHVQSGGLLQHSVEVAMYTDRLAKVLSDVAYGYFAGLTPDDVKDKLPRRIGEPVSWDLAVTGALLHDIGKLKTYTTEGLAFTMTTEGALLEHIVVGCQIIKESNAAKKYPQIAELLLHIIAAHHGKFEYGSPVLPAMLEAYLVHMADDISTTCDSFVKLCEDNLDNLKLTGLQGFNKTVLSPIYVKNVIQSELTLGLGEEA